MRKLLKKLQKDISLLLVVALLFGCLPQNAMMASAMEAKDANQKQEEIAEEENLQKEEAGEISVPGIQLQAETDYTVTVSGNSEMYTFDGAATVSAGSDYSFTVTAKEEYAVTKVEVAVGEADPEVLTAGEDGKTYTVNKDLVTTNLTIIITATANESGSVSGNVSGNGSGSVSGNVSGNESGSVSGNVSGNESGSVSGNEPTVSENTEYTVTKPVAAEGFTFRGEEKVSKGQDYTFSVSGQEGYTISKVEMKIGEGEAQLLTAEEDGTTYIIEASKITGDFTILVTVAEIPRPAKQLQFIDNAEHATFTVAEAAGVSKAENSETTYNIAQETEFISFTVTMTGNYYPKIILRDGELPNPQAVIGENTTSYTYTITYGDLVEGNNQIIIEEEADGTKVKVKVDNFSAVALSAVAEGKYIFNNSNGDYTLTEDGGAVYTVIVPEGTEVTFIAGLKENYQGRYEFSSAATTVDGKVKNEKVKATGFSFTVKAKDHTETLIKTQEIYWLNLSVSTEAGFRSLEAVKNVYTVEAGKTYLAEVFRGEERMPLKNVVVSSKNGSTAGISETMGTQGEVGFYTTAKADGGKKLKASIETMEGKKLDFQFNVLPELKAIKINGKANAEVKLPIRSTAEYSLAIDPAKAVIDWEQVIIEGEVTGEDAPFLAELTEEGKLRVSVLTTEAGKTGKLFLKYPDVESPVAILSVTATEPSWTTKAPTVKVESTDAHGVTLSLKTAGVAPYQWGEYFYKVILSQTYSMSGNTTYGPETVKYIPYENATGPVQIDIYNRFYDGYYDDYGNYYVEENYGSYSGGKYKIDVQLIQIQPGRNLGGEGNEENNVLLFKSKLTTKKNVAIKPYYFEDKLSVKKATTTLYVGQKDVKIGTAVFGKKTTQKEIWAYLGSYIESPDYVQVTTDEDGNIYASVSENAIPGDYYTVKVLPKAQEQTYAKAVDIKLKVVPNITDIQVSIPETIYKPVNKTASFKAQLAYNNGSNYQPKTKKVVWSIYDNPNAAGDPVDSKLMTVKNGQVTIAKNYILTGRDTYYLCAKAADYAGNPVMGIAEFTITNKPMEMGEAVIVRQNGSEYHRIAGSGDTVETPKLEHATFVVLKKGVEKKDVYSAEDILSFKESEVTYTSSNSSVLRFIGGGRLYPFKLAKNIKLTAAATDGSKTKAVLEKLTLTYQKTEGMGLNIRKAKFRDAGILYGDVLLSGTEAGKTATVQAEHDFLFWASVVDSENNAVSYTNHKLVVSGGKVINLNSANGGYMIVATKPEVIVKIIDKSVTPNVTKEYKLVNTAYKSGKTPIVKTKDKPMAYQTQTRVTYDVTFPQGVSYDMVSVTVDRNQMMKNSNDMRHLYLQAAGMKSGTIGEPMSISDNQITLNFDTPWNEGQSSWYPIMEGSYKLNFVFGNRNEAGEFVAESKPVPVTLKVGKQTYTANKNTQAKLTANYNVKFKETNEFMLTLTEKNHKILEVGSLLSANVKGKSNYFTSYFQLAYDYDESGVMHQATPGKIVLLSPYSSVPKTKYTGYVSYVRCQAPNGNEYYLFDVPITVTIQDSPAPTITTENITFSAGNYGAKSLKFKRDQKEIAIEYYYAADDNFNIEMNYDQYGTLMIMPKDTTGIKPGTYDVTVWVTDADTAAGLLYDSNKDKIGSKVTFKVTVE